MKKLYKILMIFIVATTLAMSFVAATQLVEHNFDGRFTALTPSNAQFEKTENNTYTIYVDADNDMTYSICYDDRIVIEELDDYFTGFAKGAKYQDVSKDGNLTIMKDCKGSSGDYGVGVGTDGRTVVITGNDLNQLKEIGKSVKFEL